HAGRATTVRRGRAPAQEGPARLRRSAPLRLERRSAAMNDRATVDLRRRTMVLAALVALAFLGVLGRLTYLQVVKHDEYSKLAESQQAKTIPLVARRGPILDRNGQVLAVSAKAESLYALTSRVDDKEALAAQLAPILGEPSREISRRLDSQKRFVFVKRRLPPDVVEAVRRLDAPA